MQPMISAAWQGLTALLHCKNPCPGPVPEPALAESWQGAANAVASLPRGVGNAGFDAIASDGMDDGIIDTSPSKALPPEIKAVIVNALLACRPTPGRLPSAHREGKEVDDAILQLGLASHDWAQATAKPRDDVLASLVALKQADYYNSDQMLTLVSRIGSIILDPEARRAAFSHVILHMQGRQNNSNYEVFNAPARTPSSALGVPAEAPSETRRYACADIVESVLEAFVFSTVDDRELFCKIANLGYHGAHTCLKIDDPGRIFARLLDKITDLPEDARSSEDFGQLSAGYRKHTNRPTRLLSQMSKLAVEIYGQHGVERAREALNQLFEAADNLPQERKLAFYTRVAGYADFFGERRCDVPGTDRNAHVALFEHIFERIASELDVGDRHRLNNLLADRCGWMSADKKSQAAQLMGLVAQPPIELAPQP